MHGLRTVRAAPRWHDAESSRGSSHGLCVSARCTGTDLHGHSMCRSVCHSLALVADAGHNLGAAAGRSHSSMPVRDTAIVGRTPWHIR
jgi:hypothetical protein